MRKDRIWLDEAISEVDNRHDLRLLQPGYVHPTAIVEDGAIISPSATIGPYSCVYACARIEDGVTISSHVTVGAPTQQTHRDRISDGERIVSIGKDTVVSNFVHIGRPGESLTRIGEQCYIMDHVTIGHDCILGDRVLVIAGGRLGGYTVLGDECYIGLNSSTHQHAVLGPLDMLAAHAFYKGESRGGIIWAGVPARPLKLNSVGIQRSHLSPAQKQLIVARAQRLLGSLSRDRQQDRQQDLQQDLQQ